MRSRRKKMETNKNKKKITKSKEREKREKRKNSLVFFSERAKEKTCRGGRVPVVPLYIKKK